MKKVIRDMVWKTILKSNFNITGEVNINIYLEVRYPFDVTYDTFSHPVFR